MTELIPAFQNWASLAPDECRLHPMQSYRFFVKIPLNTGWRDINGETQPPSQLEFLLYTVVINAVARDWVLVLGKDGRGYWGLVKGDSGEELSSGAWEHPAQAAVAAYSEFLRRNNNAQAN